MRYEAWYTKRPVIHPQLGELESSGERYGIFQELYAECPICHEEKKARYMLSHLVSAARGDEKHREFVWEHSKIIRTRVWKR